MSRFAAGLTYDVGTTIGNYLLSEGAAVPVETDTPALVLPIDDVADIVFDKRSVSEASDRPSSRRDRKPPHR